MTNTQKKCLLHWPLNIKMGLAN